MKKIATLIFTFFILNVQSQNNSFYSVESEYTTTFGYRYFFDKTNPSTGLSTQLSQLPIAGYYLGSKFFNCYGNYVFCGIDSSTTSTPYLIKLFEVDTLGNVVRTLPVSSMSGAGPDLIYFAQSLNSQMYYGIRVTATSAREFVSIHPITGVYTVLASIYLPYSQPTPTSAIQANNNFYFLERNTVVNNNAILYKADFAAGTITATDSLLPPNDMINLTYDCQQDSIVGFVTPFPYNVNGAQWIKINDANGKISFTGTYFASGAGTFYTTGYTILNGGTFYAKTYSNEGTMFNTLSPTGSTFSPTTNYLNPLDLKLISAPEKHCTNYYTCLSTGIAEHLSGNNLVTVYPNPFADNTTFIVNSEKMNEIYSFELIDVLGKKVKSINGITAKQFEVSRNGLENGIYFYKIYSSESIIGVGKVVIE
ncbi:hypothetical protein BH10BAC1_BH10BAC1_01620 [soil metagenome]